jgi:hypothetical protein
MYCDGSISGNKGMCLKICKIEYWIATLLTGENLIRSRFTVPHRWFFLILSGRVDGLIDGCGGACEGGASIIMGPLSPAAPSFVWLGHLLQHRIPQKVFLSLLIICYFPSIAPCTYVVNEAPAPVFDFVYLNVTWRCLTLLLICCAWFCILKLIEKYALISMFCANYGLYSLCKHKLLSHILWSRLSSYFYLLILSRNIACIKLCFYFILVRPATFHVSDGLWWLDANSPMLSYFAD